MCIVIVIALVTVIVIALTHARPSAFAACA